MKMLKTLSALFIALILISQVNAQDKLLPNGIQVLQLQMETYSGNNGACVAYNPKQDVYYAAYAGNATFPMTIFDEKGTKIITIEPGVDIRGLWYNKKSKSLECNTYNREGIYRYSLDKSGIPSGKPAKHMDNTNSPDDQAVGTFDGKKKLYYSNDDGKILIYSIKDHSKLGEVELQGISMRNYAMYCLVYTGVKKYEIGMLNYNTNSVSFYNVKDGSKSGDIKLPVPFDVYDAFNFAYCNDLVWVMDKDSKVWYGFEVFK